MKFEIHAADEGCRVGEEEKYGNESSKADLEKIGYTFRIRTSQHSKVSYWEVETRPTKEFLSLEALMGFVREVGNCIIEEGKLTIYNGCME